MIESESVFISYSRKDEARVRTFADALRKEELKPIWDVELEIGDSFRKNLLEYIQETRATIVIWTANSVESDWVQKESIEALSLKKYLPIKFDKSVSPPPLFEGLHVEDLSEWNGDPKHPAFGKLIKAIKQISDTKSGWSDIFGDPESFKRDYLSSLGNLFGLFFGNSSSQVGGLPIAKLLGGSIALGLLSLLVFAIILSSIGLFGFMSIMQFWWAAIFAVLIGRLMHQFALLSSKGFSVRFFSNDYSFWFMISSLCGLLVGGLIVIALLRKGHPPLDMLGIFAATTVGAAFVCLLASGFVRFFLSSIQVAFRRI